MEQTLVRAVAITLCGCAALAVGAISFTQTGSDAPVQVPAMQVPARQSMAPASVAVPDLRLRLAQQYGTVCQTPEGTVCTVAPQPINSRCQCGDTFGLIVR